jgi:hypothetical protein
MEEGAGVFGEMHGEAQSFNGFGIGEADFAEALAGELIAGGGDAVGASLKIGEMHGFNFFGMFAQNLAGPERAGDIAAGGFEFCGEATIEDLQTGKVELTSGFHR